MDPFFERTLPGRFASFSNLETLRMSALSLRAFDNAAVEHTFGHIGHSLRTLSISDFTTDPEKFLFLISLLPNLRRIKIIAVNLLSGEGRPESNRQHSFNFTGHITSYRRGTEGFFHYIAGLHPRFESLQASMITHSLVDTFNLVVRSCSETLATISITPMSHGLEGNPSWPVTFIANPILLAVGAISQLDLSPCYNLRALKVDPRVADLTEFNTLLQTVSSVYFEKLVMGPIVSGLPEETKATDQAFCSLAERLYKLGAKKPLKMVLELSPETQEIYETSDIQRAWPLFCEVGVVVEEYGFGL